MTTRSTDRRQRGGFTLIEVLLVLVILVIIGSLAVGIYLPFKEQADRDAAQFQVDAFDTPLGLYKLNLDYFPTTNQGLEALRLRPSDLQNPTKWKGPYFQEIPMDPWGNPYQYECFTDENQREDYRIWSCGPNGASGDEDDITSWETGQE